MSASTEKRILQSAKHGTKESDNLRWPQFFKDVDKAQLFLRDPNWELLCRDLERLAEIEAAIVLDRWPKNEGELGEQNFKRGYIAALKELLGLSEELAKWRENR